MSKSESATILIVDDDDAVRRMLRRFLEGEGFAIEEATDGAALRDAARGSRCDLVLLDVNLDGESGLDLLKEFRTTSDAPVIFISGKGELVDRVVGLELGADDYITKPFELREVLARVRTVLRRARPVEPAAVPSSDTPLRFADWRFDRARRTLTDPKGAPVALTTGEFNLLSVFVDHPLRPLSRDQLLELLRGAEWTPYDRSVDTQVGRLRRKIEADPSAPALIKSVRGVGYVFSAAVTRA